ncbi:endo alpha-1,4 polygalactosaminidase [Lentzea sp. E54]|uniref:endo alpha-1,4 polygalactosaminidase n=1 Tax=Lentzea xerophila TaxID=3435883 RepID=UPI003DA431B2
MTRSRLLLSAALAVTAATALAAGPLTTSSQAEDAGATAAVRLPPTSGVLDYQLGAAYTPPSDVTLVTRDSTASPEPGKYNICYVNGFQTQPGESAYWRDHRGHLLVQDASGNPVIDPGWPKEYLLDTSTQAKRTELASIIGAVIDRCADKGFQAVEIDNLDSYLRARGKLTVNHNLAFASLLKTRAHDRGLAIGQKNAAEESARARGEVGFDFAVSEECHAWDECAAYSDVYGGHVMNIEYDGELRGTFEDVCDDPQTPAVTTLRDKMLVSPEDGGYVFDHC